MNAVKSICGAGELSWQIPLTAELPLYLGPKASESHTVKAPMTEYEARERLAAVARSWIGTPFFPGQAVKGVGADCVQFALAVYKEAGIAPADMKLPAYDLGGGDHLVFSIVLTWLKTCPYVALESDMPGMGSLITLRVGRVDHHVGIMVAKRKFVHAIRKYGVVEMDIADSTWAEKLKSSWRPVILET